MSGQKISPKRFERITDAQAAMTDIVVTSAAKIQRKRKCTTCFARKMSKHAVKHIFRAFSERFSERLGEIYP
jgi:hypothetical protein